MRLLMLYVSKKFMSLAQPAPGTIPAVNVVPYGASYPAPSRRVSRR